MFKIWEKIWTRTYCKFLFLPFKCESQFGPENQMIWEMSSHCDKNSAHNVRDKNRWIPFITKYSVEYSSKVHTTYHMSKGLRLDLNLILKFSVNYWWIKWPSMMKEFSEAFFIQYWDNLVISNCFSYHEKFRKWL